MNVDDVYDSGDEQRRILALLDPRYIAMLAAVHQAVQVAFNLDPNTFTLSDEATNRILGMAAQRVTLIDQTAREALQEVLQQGQALGLSNWQIAHGSAADNFPGIDAMPEFDRARAEMIARTELAEASLASARDRYQASGLVSHVRISDGGSATSDAACNARNGQVVPITEPVGTLHPNCTVSVAPVMAQQAAA